MTRPTKCPVCGGEDTHINGDVLVFREFDRGRPADKNIMRNPYTSSNAEMVRYICKDCGYLTQKMAVE